MNFSSMRLKFFLIALAMLPVIPQPPALAHGSHGGADSELDAGEFDFTPIVAIEGHGGFDTNLEGDPEH